MNAVLQKESRAVGPGAVEVRPGPVGGRIQAPSSKSITHRALLLAALSDQPSRVVAPLQASDTLATLSCLHALGARFAWEDGGPRLRFEPSTLMPPAEALDCGNSGTTLRLLAATAARLGAPVVLTGDGSLRRRPNGPLLEAMRSLGVGVTSRDGKAPLRVHGPMRPGVARLPPRCSSQFASALLLSLPMLEGPSDLLLEGPVASWPYAQMTLEMARQAGLEIRLEPAGSGDGGTGGTGSPVHLRVQGSQSPRLGSWRVEGDWSAAAFPFAAAAVTGGIVTVSNVCRDSLQGDRAILGHLERFGCVISESEEEATVEGSALESPGVLDLQETPDLFPALAVVAAVARGTTTFTGGSQLRAKESDRIRAMMEGLQAMGIQCESTADGLVVHGGKLEGASVSCGGDHRIHMAFVVAGLAARGMTRVDGGASAKVSYPDFHAALAGLGAGIQIQAAHAAPGVQEDA